MDPKEAVERVLETIGRERQCLGWGQAGQLDRKLHRSEGHVSRLLAGRRNLRLEQLFEIVEALELEPGEFFVSAFGVEYRPGIERFLHALEKKSERSPLVRQLDIKLARISVDNVVESPAPDATKWREAVQDLEELRFSHPLRVREESEALLVTMTDPATACEVESLCSLLACLGSAERMRNRYPVSAGYLRRALEVSRKHGFAKHEADLLQRCGYLVADQGDLVSAIACASRAAEIYTLLHDLPGVGKCLVDHGIMYRNGGNLSQAIPYFESALTYLPQSLWRSRVMALYGLAFVHLELGRPDVSGEFLDRARKEHKTREGYTWRKMGWLQAELALVREELEEAEAVFVSVREFFATHDNSVDVALISLRLAKVYLLSGRIAKLQSTMSDMVELLQPVRRENAIAGGVLNDVLRKALAGKVTTDVLDRAYRRLQQALEQQPKRTTAES